MYQEKINLKPQILIEVERIFHTVHSCTSSTHGSLRNRFLSVTTLTVLPEFKLLYFNLQFMVSDNDRQSKVLNKITQMS